MNIRDIPVRVVGPGSQPTGSDGDAVTYMDMPSDMSTFVAPVMPEPEDVMLMDGAREAMDWLRAALDGYGPGGEPVLADLSALDEESRDVVNQILGEGEVSIVCDGQVRARTQESVLAGVWRTLFFDSDDHLVCACVQKELLLIRATGRGNGRCPGGLADLNGSQSHAAAGRGARVDPALRRPRPRP